MQDKTTDLVQMANRGNPAAIIELTRRRDLDNGIIPTCEAFGLSELPLRRHEIRLMTQVPRSIECVKQELRDVFAKLASAKLRWPLFLHGPAGSGKTMASLCLCDITLTAMYSTVDVLCDRIMAGSGVELWNSIGGKDLAVLDELGDRMHVNELHYKAVKRFCDAREGANRVAIYISNLNAKELREIYDDRIVSRVCCGTVIELGGVDRRLTN
jgi:DNA replication protein DnaC